MSSCDPRDVMRQKATEMQFARAEWLDDVIAGLLAAGCLKSEIEVRSFRDDPLRTVVAVRGVPKYEWRGKFTIDGEG